MQWQSIFSTLLPIICMMLQPFSESEGSLKSRQSAIIFFGSTFCLSTSNLVDDRAEYPYADICLQSWPETVPVSSAPWWWKSRVGASKKDYYDCLETSSFSCISIQPAVRTTPRALLVSDGSCPTYAVRLLYLWCSYRTTSRVRWDPSPCPC